MKLAKLKPFKDVFVNKLSKVKLVPVAAKKVSFPSCLDCGGATDIMVNARGIYDFVCVSSCQPELKFN